MPDHQIQIVVNGKPLEIAEQSSVLQLLSVLEIRHRAVAVEVNAKLLANQSYGDCRLADGDQVEIVSLVGGG